MTRLAATVRRLPARLLPRTRPQPRPSETERALLRTLGGLQP